MCSVGPSSSILLPPSPVKSVERVEQQSRCNINIPSQRFHRHTCRSALSPRNLSVSFIDLIYNQRTLSCEGVNKGEHFIVRVHS